MCLLLGLHCKEITLKEDLKVYKMLSGDNESPYFCFKYSENSTYRLRKKLTVSRRIVSMSMVSEGFHFYSSITNAINEWKKFGVQRYLYYIVEMTIPRGAKVYYSHDGTEIVSTSVRTGSLTALLCN